MAEPYRPETRIFGNRGIAAKLDPGLLGEGQFQRLVNVTSLQEGSLVTVNGYQKLNLSGGGSISLIHTIGRVATGTDPTQNYRYLGEGEDIYRINSTDNPALGTTIANTGNFGRRWSMLAYRKEAAGVPYGYFGTDSRMFMDPLKDNPTDALLPALRTWGLDAPIIPAAMRLAETLSNGPKGQYFYVYTFRDPISGTESNPCPLPVLSGFIDTGTNFQAIEVSFSNGTPAEQAPGDTGISTYVNPRVAGEKKAIAIYRRGGAYFDGLYRLVTYVDCPSAFGTGFGPPDNPSFIFKDTVPDSAIASNPIAEFDNDRPVSSDMPVAFFGTCGPLVENVNVGVTVTVEQGYPAGVPNDLRNILRPGTLLTVGSGEFEEVCALWALPSATTITLWCQNPHPEATVKLRATVMANTPCDLVATAFNSIFLAGDPNNPNRIYKSKSARPEAFPIINEGNETTGYVDVGTVGNPIVNITEFNGDIVCLNHNGIYLVRVWGGAMQEPIRTPAQRGLYGRDAWCKVDNEIWYLSYDGVYSWSGGQSNKRSEAIDPLFKGETVNGMRPISLDTTRNAGNNFISQLDWIQFSYYRNEVRITYRDVDNVTWQLRYHTIYDRWYQTTEQATGVNFEEDTGLLLFATATGAIGGAALNVADTPVSPSIPSTTKGWTNGTHDNGTPVVWEAFTGFFSFQSPSMNKQFGDIVLELTNPAETVTCKVYYNYSSTATETLTISNLSGRRRFVLPLDQAYSREAYAIAFQFTGSTSQPTLLHSLTFHWLPLEEPQRGRAYDWDNLGHPHDKKLQQVSIEYDTQGFDVTVALDIMYGIEGNLYQSAVETFLLHSWVSVAPPTAGATGPTRARPTFAIPDGVVCKLVRLRPLQSTTDFKIWNYKFEFLPYPPDKVLFTDWTDDGYPCEKILREVVLDVDTGDVDAEVAVEVDGSDPNALIAAQEIVHSTNDDRQRILTFNSDIIGAKFRLLNAPGTGGKFQLFNHKFNWIPEPCKVVHWDSYEQAFGYNGFKFLKQLWVEYYCLVNITVSVYCDDYGLLYSITLPAHDHRDIERFYLPVTSEVGNADAVLNKSKIYRFVIDACDMCTPFKLYRDGTRAEIMMLSGDMRQGYTQNALWEPQPIPAF